MGAFRHVAMLVVLAVAAAVSAGCRASPPEIEDIELDPRPHERVPVFELFIDDERPAGWSVYRAERLPSLYP